MRFTDSAPRVLTATEQLTPRQQLLANAALSGRRFASGLLGPARRFASGLLGPAPLADTFRVSGGSA